MAKKQKGSETPNKNAPTNKENNTSKKVETTNEPKQPKQGFFNIGTFFLNGLVATGVFLGKISLMRGSGLELKVLAEIKESETLDVGQLLNVTQKKQAFESNKSKLDSLKAEINSPANEEIYFKSTLEGLTKKLQARIDHVESRIAELSEQELPIDKFSDQLSKTADQVKTAGRKTFQQIGKGVVSVVLAQT